MILRNKKKLLQNEFDQDYQNKNFTWCIPCFASASRKRTFLEINLRFHRNFLSCLLSGFEKVPFKRSKLQRTNRLFKLVEKCLHD